MATSPLTRVIHELCGVALQWDAMADGDLLEAFLRQREEAAFAVLVRRHGPMVLGVCRRLLQHTQDAEDAFQATFLVLACKAATVQPRAQVGSWLHGVARRTALEARKRKARRRSHEQAMHDLPPTHAPDATEVWSDLQPLLDDELSRLPDKYRTAILLCDVQGQSRKTAAHQLRVPEGTLSSRLAAGRKLLAERLQRRGVTLASGSLGLLLSQNALAAVAAALGTATARAATAMVLGGAASAGVSAEVAALTEGVLRAMWMTKFKLALALLLAALVCVLGRPSGLEPARAEKPLPAVAPPVQPVKKWTERATLQGHQGTVQTLAFGAEMLASGSKDGRIKLWNVANAREENSLFDHSPKGEVVLLAVRGNDQQLGIGVRRGEVYNLHVLNITKNPLHGRGRGGRGLQPLALLSDFQTWACAMPNHGLLVREFPLLAAGKNSPDEIYAGHTEVIHAVAFSADEKLLATVSADKTVRLWQRGQGKAKFSGVHGAEVLAVALTANGKTLVSADKAGLVKVWDAATGKERATLQGHKGGVRALALAPDGKLLASAGDDGQVGLWDLATGKRVALLTGHKAAVMCVAFSRDGSTLASAGADKTIKLWSAPK